jgi:hypothetical protein
VAFVKIMNLARLRSIYLGMTLMQRQQLKVIVGGVSHSLNTRLTEDLIGLGLVLWEEDEIVATEDAHYVASLF